MDLFDSTEFLRKLTSLPGVYRMYDVEDAILYIGKAKDLKNRVSSYFRSTGHTLKTQALVSRIARMDVTVTHSEMEALLLEQNQIKQWKPPYNILLRDDKSYPYIFRSSHKEFPSLTQKRTRARKRDGEYFGPYPSSYAVKESLNLLQKIFKIRQCDDSFFRNRSRPCLQYQIDRCSAPCVGLITAEEYLKDVERACRFLRGKSPELIRELIVLMEKASDSLEFERAAQFRDQIQHLRHVQEVQAVESGSANRDVIGLAQQSGIVVIALLMFRGGRLLGNKTFYPDNCQNRKQVEILEAFTAQYYLQDQRSSDYPSEIILPAGINDNLILQQTIYRQAGRKIRLTSKVRGERQKWLNLAQTNAQNALATSLKNKSLFKTRLLSLRDAFLLPTTPKRIECFDISHSSGEKTVASCVVFTESGPCKSEYRLFNIDGVNAGDDYAAMEQALRRRLKKIHNEESKKPDVLVVDGGKGQLGVAVRVLNELKIGGIYLIGVAKGITRKAGFETLLVPQPENQLLKEMTLVSESDALHLIQHIRDESHRFAITGHRKQRDKSRRRSTLESLGGVGVKRRKALLKYFGDLSAIMKANIEEITKVQGISQSLATQIYHQLHEGN